MQIVFDRLNFLIKLLLISFALDFPFVDLAGAAASPCDPACPVWISGAEVPPCDPTKKCSSFRADWMYIPEEPGAAAPETNLPQTQSVVSVPLVPTYEDPMRIAIVRNANSTCEPLCPEWISLSGMIMPETPSKLRKVLKQLGARRLPIVIDSNGGAVDAAMEMGRMI